MLLLPRAMYRDPFRGGKNILVMCDAYEPPRPGVAGKDNVKLKPLPTNTRAACAEAMEKAKAEKPWFGIEQVCLPAPTSLSSLLSPVHMHH